jgi:NAD(P)H-hydrate repair Nnr-like enzyme with NAD(P)H-hydrate epimerase domain
MYPWDSDSQGDYPPEPLRSWKAPAPVETSPAHPVQVALDRRDNGGDALAAAAQVAAPQVAASQAAPGQPATPPTPGRTRQ